MVQLNYLDASQSISALKIDATDLCTTSRLARQHYTEWKRITLYTLDTLNRGQGHDSQTTGPDGAVAKSSGNGLVGTGFTSR